MDESLQSDICRVCRCEGTPDRPLFHPCICTGSIKFIHQECLVQWLRYSRKEYCELCTHRFSFTPIYSPDMPKRLPLKDILSGLVSSLARAIRFWLHYTLVAMAWLGIVPLTACRIYRCLFTGSVSSVLTLPLDMLSSEHVATDILHGCVVVLCTLCAFIGLVWLREQILHGGGPDWLEQDIQNEQEHVEMEQPAEAPGVDADVPVQNNARADVNAEGVGEANVPAPNNVGQQGQAQGQAQDDVNWNLMEWDRAEELTWERLLGLDGSLVFLEHVFWVASLNTLFILVFAFCPYHIGHFTIVGFKMKDWVSACHFEGLLTTLCGYVVIGLFLVLLHGVTSLLRLRRPKRILGLCYVVVKVSLLTVAEIGVFPIVCGWWLDICSLPLVDATFKDRLHNFSQAPGTSMFLHWLVGILCAFYFASFVLLLREVLRPGVLWFLRNLNDPDFNPVQEMIHLPIVRHLRQFAASLVIFGTIVFLMLWVPIRILQKGMPNFLPYYIVNSTDTQVSEYSLELLLLQVIMPCLLEQNHARQWLLYGLRMWCLAVSWLLGLRSYLLGDVSSSSESGEGQPHHNNQGVVIGENGEEEEEDDDNEQNDVQHHQMDQPAAPAEPVAAPPAQEENILLGGIPFRNGGLGAAHQALLQREGPAGYVPYLRPPVFFIRIILLLFIMCISLSVASTIFLTLPVWIGRFLMETFYGAGPHHELYTAFAGLYFCWLVLRGIHVFSHLVPRGWSNVFVRIKSYTILVLKCTVAFSLLLGVIPLLFGLLLDLVVVVPLRVAVNQSPIFSLSQDWSLGVLYTKIVCGLTMMSPDWWLKHSLEKLYQDGIRRMNLTFVLCELAIPAIVTLGLALALPYVVAHSIVPFFVPSRQLRALIARRVYPSFLVVILLMVFSVWQLKQFKRLYEHIKNDKYLVGRRLVNYNHRIDRNENAQTT
ncbi:E3 ubiquitin-protein ligase MARCHF6-like isoform X3 [Daphnia pulex]|uniref:E3 ubiquitin-protein ligase MARCHF6-like isoform X3 n=1 Tax=Daphnia pulex TaxID=6669 RepID=UPI001EDCB0A0|nr:E3 ubiquitin-protein ligase MARCHF6-like isoform X3 [Daphnia pulex]